MPDPMTSCPRLGKLFNGCRFKPRYDLGAPAITDCRGSRSGVLQLIETSKPKTYIHDICESCGKTVRRS